jgi:riboflavin kinase/FMN adenylyltransferase
VVEAGDQVGRQLGYPTANLRLREEILPPNGVYAVRAQYASRQLKGVVNIGVRPTIAKENTQRRLELHLFDFDEDLYGQSIEVSFIQKLRDEQKFDSLAELKSQIGRDEARSRQLLGN